VPIWEEEIFTPMSSLGYILVSSTRWCFGAVEVHTWLDDSTAVADL
jgi:hypothetical protein